MVMRGGGTCSATRTVSCSPIGTRSAMRPGKSTLFPLSKHPGSDSLKISGTHLSLPTDATSSLGTGTPSCVTSGRYPLPARSCAMATSTRLPNASCGSDSGPSARATTSTGHHFDGICLQPFGGQVSWQEQACGGGYRRRPRGRNRNGRGPELNPDWGSVTAHADVRLTASQKYE